MKLYGSEKIFDLELINGKKVKAIGFWGKESVFSNFHPCNIEFSYCDENRVVKTSEQLFMVFKADVFNDQDSALGIINAPNPMMAKSIGRSVKNYNDETWSSKRYSFMKQTLLMKFSQNQDLLDRLLETDGIHLVEASPYDSIWGVKLGVENLNIEKERNWLGDNLLGKALMEVREIFKNNIDIYPNE